VQGAENLAMPPPIEASFSAFFQNLNLHQKAGMLPSTDTKLGAAGWVVR